MFRHPDFTYKRLHFAKYCAAEKGHHNETFEQRQANDIKMFNAGRDEPKLLNPHIPIMFSTKPF